MSKNKMLPNKIAALVAVAGAVDEAIKAAPLGSTSNESLKQNLLTKLIDSNKEKDLSHDKIIHNLKTFKTNTQIETKLKNYTNEIQRLEQNSPQDPRHLQHLQKLKVAKKKLEELDEQLKGVIKVLNLEDPDATATYAAQQKLTEFETEFPKYDAGNTKTLAASLSSEYNRQVAKAEIAVRDDKIIIDPEFFSIATKEKKERRAEVAAIEAKAKGWTNVTICMNDYGKKHDDVAIFVESLLKQGFALDNIKLASYNGQGAVPITQATKHNSDTKKLFSEKEIEEFRNLEQQGRKNTEFNENAKNGRDNDIKTGSLLTGISTDDLSGLCNEEQTPDVSKIAEVLYSLTYQENPELLYKAKALLEDQANNADTKRAIFKEYLKNYVSNISLTDFTGNDQLNLEQSKSVGTFLNTLDENTLNELCDDNGTFQSGVAQNILTAMYIAEPNSSKIKALIEKIPEDNRSEVINGIKIKVDNSSCTVTDILNKTKPSDDELRNLGKLLIKLLDPAKLADWFEKIENERQQKNVILALATQNESRRFRPSWGNGNNPHYEACENIYQHQKSISHSNGAELQAL